MMPYPDNNSDKASGCECSSGRIPIIPTIIPTKCRDRRHEMAGKAESRHESRQCVAILRRYRRPPSNREIGKWVSCVNATLSWQSLRRVRRNFIREALTFCGSLFKSMITEDQHEQLAIQWHGQGRNIEHRTPNIGPRSEEKRSSAEGLHHSLGRMPHWGGRIERNQNP